MLRESAADSDISTCPSDRMTAGKLNFSLSELDYDLLTGMSLFRHYAPFHSAHYLSIDSGPVFRGADQFRAGLITSRRENQNHLLDGATDIIPEHLTLTFSLDNDTKN